MKRVISIVICAVMLLGSVSVQGVSVANSDAWRDAYAKCIRENRFKHVEGGWDYECTGFALHDMDKDGMPELILGIIDSATRGYTYIYTYTNKLVYAGEKYGAAACGGNVSQNPKFPGLFTYMYGYGILEEHYYYVELKNGELVETEICTGFWGEKPDEIYNQELYDENKKATYLDLHETTESNISLYIYNKIAHYYVESLDKFMSDVGNNDTATAILVDLDNDGFDEMVALKVIEYYDVDRRDIDYKIVVGVFDIENGKNHEIYIEDENPDNDNMGECYITDKNCIIVAGVGQTAPGFFGSIYQYKNNTIKETKFSAYDGEEGSDFPDDFSINGQEMTSKQFEVYNKEFNVYNQKRILYNWDNENISDDTAKILAMTSVSSVTATPTAAKVTVNGKVVEFDAYNIDGNNYFKLRDLAYILKGTKKQFEVSWDSAKNAINLTSNKAYTAVGGEMRSKGKGSKTATATNSKVYLDNKEVNFTAYTIDNNNYFKLRDIGKAFNFNVSYDSKSNTIVINTNESYADD